MNNNVVIEKSPGGNVTYYIKEKERIVVAVLKMSGDEFTHSIDRVVEKNMSQTKEVNAFCPRYFGSFFSGSIRCKEFTGIARCSINDEWNPEIGKRIAFLKANKKCKRYLFNSAVSAVQFFTDVANDMKNYAFKMSMSIEKLRDECTFLSKNGVM